MRSEIKFVEGEGSHSNGATIDIDQENKRKHKEHVLVLDIGGLASAMETRVAPSKIEYSSPPTICRVPSNIRKDNEAAYSPKIVSIGPLHRLVQELHPMEVFKLRYLGKFLDRIKPRETALERCLDEMKKIQTQAKSCYSDHEITKLNMTTKEFIEMMVLDGCFIIEMLLLSHEKDHKNDKLDPICYTDWMLPLITDDMILLENQLPFFVLEHLWCLTGGPPDVLSELILAFFKKILPKGYNPLKPANNCVDHLLHFIHLSLAPSQSIKSATTPKLHLVIRRIIPLLRLRRKSAAYTRLASDEADDQTSSSLESGKSLSSPLEMIPTVTELQEAGVGFQRAVDTENFTDVTFDGGVMKMPLLFISDCTNSYLRNFIAFEQCFPYRGVHFTDYCCFIDSLVNTESDVGILKRLKIIVHQLGSDKEVARLFNTLCKGITPDFNSSYLAEDYKRMVAYTEKRWPRWRRILVRDYFSHPWAVFSLMAAIFLLVVALAQTILSFLSYFWN